MLKKLIIATAIYSLALQFSYAQYASPPSLAVGLSGLVSERGNIDVELLTEIISQKQDELKKEGIRRIMNKEVLNHSYALWDFTNHSLEMLLYSKDKKAIEKELAEYATNLVLVYGFAEAYLQASYQLGNSELSEAMNSFPFKNKMRLDNWKMFTDTLRRYSGENVEPKEKLRLKSTKIFWIARLGLLDETSFSKTNDSVISFNSFFLDLIYDVLKENKTIRDIGFFSEADPISEKMYKDKSKFWCVKNYAKTNNSDSTYDKLRNRIDEELSIFLTNYYTLKATYNSGLSINDLFKTLSDSEKTPTLKGMFKNELSINDSFVSRIRNVEVEKLLSVSTKIAEKVNASSSILSLSKTDSLAVELNECIHFLRRIRANADQEFNNNDLLYLREKAMPLFLELNMTYGIGQSYLDDMRVVLNFIYAKNIFTIKNEIAKLKYNKLLASLPLDRFYDFVKLLTELHKLDKANTYDYVFNNIKQVSTVLPNGKAKTYLSVLTDNVERFAFINREENKIEIDVEEILLQLYKRYAEQKSFPVKFYLSLGLNQTAEIKYDDDKYVLRQSGSDSTSTPINSLSFASEKIGIKLSLLPLKNYDKSLRFKKEEELAFRKAEPFISDLHLMIFGSGILYNIVNSKTSKSFTYPLIGYGAGLSFFNGLDANLFVAYPIVSSEKLNESLNRRRMIGFSMDIKFMEYIDALRKKRAEQKNKS